MNGPCRSFLLALMTLTVPIASIAQEADDPYLWLEEVEGERAMAWVTERSDATLAAGISSSTWGIAARSPTVAGSKPGRAASGSIQRSR